jgi:DNA-binding response OmpR family regulator
MSPNAALEAAGKIGADAVLPKPFSINDLRELVTGLLGEGQDGD